MYEATLDPTAFLDSNLTEVLAAIDDVSTGNLQALDAQGVESVTSLVAVHLVDSIRDDSTHELAALAPKIAGLARRVPSAQTQLHTLAHLTSIAARRTTPSAIPAVLRSFSGKAERALAWLATQRVPARQKNLCSHLGMTDSNCSHLVGDLFRAGLIERERNGQFMQLALTHEGREYVAQHVEIPPGGITEYMAAITQVTRPYDVKSARTAFRLASTHSLSPVSLFDCAS